MKAFGELSGRGQLRRLRRLGRAALRSYPGDLGDARLTLLRHEQNVTYRVDGEGTRHVLRISRPDLHSDATIGSEAAWLAALGRDTALRVPVPATARDGSLVVAASDPGVPEPRLCVLLGWIDGRFVNRGLTPDHLGRFGELIAGLQEHAVSWTPPAGFTRPRVDTLTAETKLATLGGRPTMAGVVTPSIEDGELAIELVQALVSDADARTVGRAIELVRATTTALATRPDAFGLIHSDLHQENVLFAADGVAGAIDFDDCGWGFFLYDLAVPLSEVSLRPTYRAMRAALLDAYARRRQLPDDADTHIDAFIALRGLQLLTWVLESRRLPAFRDRWVEWAREELDWLAGRVASAG